MTEGPIEAVKRAERKLCLLQYQLGFAQGSASRLRTAIKQALWLAESMPSVGRPPQDTLYVMEEALRAALKLDHEIAEEEEQRARKRTAQPVDDLRPPD